MVRVARGAGACHKLWVATKHRWRRQSTRIAGADRLRRRVLAGESGRDKTCDITTAKPTKSAEPAEVPASLRFSGTTVDGKPFDGASLQGKPVLIWFWAPWCPTCHSQIPQVQRLAKQYDGQLSVIGVGSLDDAAAIKRFAAQVPGVTHLIDERGTVWKHFGVVEQSSFVLLDGRGEIKFRTGYGGSEALADKVAAVAN